MDNQQTLEDANSEFLTLTYDDEVLVSNSEHLSNECRNISKLLYIFMLKQYNQLFNLNV